MIANTKEKIPALRFPEFEGEWEERRLGEVATFFSGGTPLTTKTGYYFGDIPFIKSGEINADRTEQFISEDGLKNSTAKRVKKGDLLYALYGATSGEVGISKIDGAINQAVLCIRSSQLTYFIFLFLQFNKTKIVNTYLQGGQGNLSAHIIKSIKINLPSLPEQQKIAAFLTTVDTRIQQLTRKKDLLEQYKKGVMQQIFSQEIRFRDDQGKAFPEWEEKRLGEIGEFIGGGTPSTNNPEYWNGTIPWISSSDLSDDNIYHVKMNRLISQKAIANSATKLVPKNSILIVSRVGVGKIAITPCDLCTSQDFTSLSVNQGNTIFLAYLLKRKVLTLLSFNQGTSIKGFLKSDLEDLIIPFPSLPEQQKIAAFLSSIDVKIDQVGKQLEGMQRFKKGLLQQMFV